MIAAVHVGFSQSLQCSTSPRGVVIQKLQKPLEATVARGSMLRVVNEEDDMSDSSINAKTGSCDTGEFILPGEGAPRLTARQGLDCCCGTVDTTVSSCCGPTTSVDAPT